MTANRILGKGRQREPTKALPHLKRAAELLASDQAAQYGYAKALVEDGNLSDADQVLKKAIALNEHSEIAELCREARTRIAHLNVRGGGDAGTLRMDVVMYCLAALQKFKELGREKTQAVAYEIAMLGRSGLDINKPDSRYQLKSLLGISPSCSSWPTCTWASKRWPPSLMPVSTSPGSTSLLSRGSWGRKRDLDRARQARGNWEESTDDAAHLGRI